MRGKAQNQFVWIAILVALLILYGSLYPFAFYLRTGAGPLQTLLETWANRPGRGDLLSNILLYLPLGGFCALGLFRHLKIWPRIVVITLIGSTLSLCIELAQYYDMGRDTQATDFYANTVGTALGAAMAMRLRFKSKKIDFGLTATSIVPVLLLLAWLSYKLFPFVPVIDLHKYWHAVRPLLSSDGTFSAGIFRNFVMALVCACLINLTVTSRNSFAWFVSFSTFILVAKVFVIGGALSRPEVCGVALAALLFFPLRRAGRPLYGATALLLTIYLIYMRLEPWSWNATPRAFGWIPFLSLMQGSINVNVLSFLEKFFIYGSLVWLLNVSRVRLVYAVAFVALLLFSTSWLERYQTGRSAEITDAALAILIGLVFGLATEARDVKARH